jgi:hypothetical protein
LVREGKYCSESYHPTLGNSMQNETEPHNVHA